MFFPFEAKAFFLGFFSNFQDFNTKLNLFVALPANPIKFIKLHTTVPQCIFNLCLTFFQLECYGDQLVGLDRENGIIGKQNAGLNNLLGKDFFSGKK